MTLLSYPEAYISWIWARIDRGGGESRRPGARSAEVWASFDAARTRHSRRVRRGREKYRGNDSDITVLLGPRISGRHDDDLRTYERNNKSTCESAS